MKKVIFFTTIAIFISVVSFAQDRKLEFSVGPELHLATGSFSNTHSLGIGATGQLEIPIQDKLDFTGTSGIIFYNGKSIASGSKYSGVNVIPIRAGLKYFIATGVYGAVQAGVGIFNQSIGTAFAYSPQIGYEFASKSGKSLDLAIKYDGYSKNGTISSIGLRLALVL